MLSLAGVIQLIAENPDPTRYYSTESKLLGFFTPGDIPLVAVLSIGLLTPIIVLTTKKFDPTRGFLTVSLVIIFSVVCAAFASMIYPSGADNAITDALVGALAAALGAIISQWLPRWPHEPRPPGDEQKPDDGE